MVIGLRQAGVRPAGWVAFLVAAPVLDPVLFGALALIAGPGTAVLYAGVTFVAAIILALLADRVGVERHLKAIPVGAGIGGPVGAGSDGAACASHDGGSHAGEPGAESCGAPTGDAPWAGVRAEIPGALRAGVGLLRTIGPILLVGVAVGVAIETLVPAGALERATTAGGALAVPLAALVGVPLYFNTELFIPIADSLTDAGVGIGAIVALTIAGAGANVPEFVLLGRLMNRRLLGSLFGYVFLVAVAGGGLAQVLVG